MKFSNRYYVRGVDPPKPHLRGWIPFFLLGISPLWLLFFWNLSRLEWKLENMVQHTVPYLLWCLSMGSTFLLFLSSTIFHYRTHPNTLQFEWVRRLDMTSIGLALFSNILPTLIYCNQYVIVILYGAYLVYSFFAFSYFKNPRKTMIFLLVGSILILLLTFWLVVPQLLQQFDMKVHPLLPLPILTCFIILFGIGFLYVFGDQDLPRDPKEPLLYGTHDMIHYLSLIMALNMGYYNSFIISLQK